MHAQHIDMYAFLLHSITPKRCLPNPLSLSTELIPDDLDTLDFHLFPHIE